MLLCFIHFLICFFFIPIHSLSLCFIVSTSSYSYNGCFWHVLRHGLLLRRASFSSFAICFINDQSSELGEGCLCLRLRFVGSHFVNFSNTKTRPHSLSPKTSPIR
uniref:Putative secreted protein n=1 Tax=Anopheles darlingi TaxID=43151 RepID=A0A2M4D9J2_ANODA